MYEDPVGRLVRGFGILGRGNHATQCANAWFISFIKQIRFSLCMLCILHCSVTKRQSLATLRIVPFSGRRALFVSVCLEMSLLIVISMQLLCNLIQIDVRYRIITVEYARNFLKRRTFRLNIEEVDKNEFDHVPARVEEHEHPVARKAVPGNLVCLTGYMSAGKSFWGMEGDILSHGQHSLHGDVHDHHALGTQMEREDFQSVRDQQAREANVVEDAE